MIELDRGGWSLAYDTAGNADGPTALLLHDISDDRRVWRALATDMGEEFRTIAPDLRGLGESGRPPAPASPPTMRDYAADLTALLDAEAVDHCAVIGAGFGAEVALELALDAPERVELIVLSGAVPTADHPSYDAALLASEGRRAERGRLAGRFGMRRAGANAAEGYSGEHLRASVRERYRGLDAEAFAAAHEARAGRGDLLPRLAALHRARARGGRRGRPSRGGGAPPGGDPPERPPGDAPWLWHGRALRRAARFRGGARRLPRRRSRHRHPHGWRALGAGAGTGALAILVVAPYDSPRGCQRMKPILALLVLLAVAASVVVVMRRSAGVDDFLDEDLD